MKRILKIDVMKFDRSIEYSRDHFRQKKKYKDIENDILGRKGVIKYLNDLGKTILEERGIDSPEFYNFEIFEEEVRARLIKNSINSKKELEVMRKAYNL